MLRHYKSMMFVLYILVPAIPGIGFAGWVGPVEVISESWGALNNQMGFREQDTVDSFPEGFWILGDKIIVRDQENRRMKIYDIDGQLEQIVNWIRQQDGSYKIDRYPLAGVTMGYFDNGLCTYFSPQQSYVFYSRTGRLLRTYTERPLELGVVREERQADGNYKLSIKYPRRTYEVVVPDQRPDRITRDVAGNLYVIQRLVDVLRGGTPEEETIQHYRVIRYDCCKELGRLDLPEDEYEVTGRDIVVGVKKRVLAEYGEPVISPNGDIYTWKRTQDSYYILKWTWQD